MVYTIRIYIIKTNHWFIISASSNTKLNSSKNMAEKHYGEIYSGSGNISGEYIKDINKSKDIIIEHYIKYKIFINYQNAWKTGKKRYI